MPNWGESLIFLLKNNDSLIGINLLTNCSFSYPELAKILLSDYQFKVENFLLMENAEVRRQNPVPA